MSGGDWSWPQILTRLLAGNDLDTGAAAWAMDRIMAGEASSAQVAAFVVALRAKGESSAELLGIADTMLRHATRIDVPQPSLDIVGTGGDRAHTVNISTMAAITAAASGVTVVKHGNRAASSASGTADVLEELGVNLTLDPAGVARVARDCGITFCFAQVFHPAMRHAAGPRRDLGIPTVFNVLGPLTNPAQPSHAAVGVADAAMAPLVAGVFAGRGKDAAVFRGDDGLDEITVATTSSVWWVSAGTVTRFVVDPPSLGVQLNPLSTLRGGDPPFNAEVVRSVLAGTRSPVRDAVLLNAGIALAVTESSSTAVTGSSELSASGLGGLDQDRFEHILRRGMDRAEQALDTGRAAEVLDRWIAATHASPG